MRPLGTYASVRERAILAYLYENQEYVCIDQGNLDAALDAVVPDTSDNQFLCTIQDLLAYDYITKDTGFGCFYSITPKGKRYYERCLQQQ